EQTQTSPTRTSLRVTVFLPVTVNSYGPPACCRGSLAVQRPSLSAVARASASDRRRTVTSSPGSAGPQTGIDRSRCGTMWSVNRGWSLTSARAAGAGSVANAHARMTRGTDFMDMVQLPSDVDRRCVIRNPVGRLRDEFEVFFGTFRVEVEVVIRFVNHDPVQP